MSTPDGRQPVATLWRLTWGDASLQCEVYRTGEEFFLSVESAVAVVVTERFDMNPRGVTRAHALRDALKRRGWVEALAPAGDPDAAPV
jgi:hypothetical protein